MAFIRTLTRADKSTAFKVVWRDPGTKKQTSFTTDSETEAELIKRLLDANGQSFTLANKAMAESRSSAPTVASMITDYLDEKTGIEPGTKRTYQVMLRRHIAPALGGRKLDSLERKDIVKWFDGINLSPKSKKNIHAFLSTTFTWAVEQGLMSENPARGISSPKSSLAVRRATFLTKPQFDILLAHIDADYRVFIRTLVSSGMRFGEATALEKRDFARKASGHYVVDVSKSWKMAANGVTLGAPKSRAGIRQITLPTALTDDLDRYLGRLRNNELAFTKPNGGRLSSGYFYVNYWRPALDTANADTTEPPLLAEPRLHDLRHTHASWLIDAGVPLPVISKRLGHSSISTTVDVYGHLATDADERAADAL